MEIGCQQCIERGFTFKKAVYPPSPSSFICTPTEAKIPLGYTIMEEVTNLSDCVGIDKKESPMIPLEFHKFVVSKLREQFKNCQKLEIEGHIFGVPPGGFTRYSPPPFNNGINTRLPPRRYSV